MSEIKSEESKAESKIGYIYSFTFPNGKQYIGQTARHYLTRWKQHKKVSNMPSAKEYDHLMYRAIRKYGWDNILKDVICSCNIEQLNDLEILYIAKMKTLSPDGYNMTTGGSQNMIMSKESRTKMSNKAKERFSNPDAIAKISDAAKKRFANPDEKKAQSERTKKYYAELRSKNIHNRSINEVRYVHLKHRYGKFRYCIKEHPFCKYRLFTSYLDDDEGQIDSLEKCLSYLVSLGDITQDILEKQVITLRTRLNNQIAIPKSVNIIKRPGFKYPDMIDKNDSNDKKEERPETKVAVGEQVFSDT